MQTVFVANTPGFTRLSGMPPYFIYSNLGGAKGYVERAYRRATDNVPVALSWDEQGHKGGYLHVFTLLADGKAQDGFWIASRLVHEWED